MAPHANHTQHNGVDIVSEENRKYKIEIVWVRALFMLFIHISAIYGLYLHLYTSKWQTVVTANVLGILSGIGVTAGVHRLWCHRSYKAKLPLRIMLMVFNTIAFQSHIFEWTRDHRVHHKYSETDSDPYNSSRGFFFSHIGWLMCKRHKDVIEKGRLIDMSDIMADPVARFQKKYIVPMVLLWCFFLPAFIPYYFWGEQFWTAFFTCSTFRYCSVLHLTFLVNSAAHLYGKHPYDKNLKPAENKLVTFTSFGEGYHNFHHAFPYDYSAAELGWKINFNLSTMFIDFFATIGWAYDLKSVSRETIRMRMERTGEPMDADSVIRKGHTFIEWCFIILIETVWSWVPLIARTVSYLIKLI